jgi:uncharacterized membrane-anchored protein YitT (DUF2179 family)
MVCSNFAQRNNHNMKKSILFAFIVTILCAINVQGQEKAKVYFTSDISSESLIKIYQALGREATGRVAVKSAQENRAATIICIPNSSAIS